MKIDVAIQSYKKPESLIYTLLSLKKHSGNYIDTIYINDDVSGDNTISYYKDEKFLSLMSPIKIEIRVNKKRGKWSSTFVTREIIRKRNIIEIFHLLIAFVVNRAKWYYSTDEIRYQWAINNTDKKYLLIIHDDMKFNGDIVSKYIDEINRDENIAIVGDMGGSCYCPFGPCGTKECSQKKVMEGYRPYKQWPITGEYKSIVYKLLGRKRRNCRINEWCCMINVNITRIIGETTGVYFGNYEFGGDIGSYWFDVIVRHGYNFSDPLTDKEEKLLFYEHCWQGHPGHSVWVKQECDPIKYEYNSNKIRKCLEDEFGYKIRFNNE